MCAESPTKDDIRQIVKEELANFKSEVGQIIISAAKLNESQFQLDVKQP